MLQRRGRILLAGLAIGTTAVAAAACGGAEPAQEVAIRHQPTEGVTAPGGETAAPTGTAEADNLAVIEKVGEAALSAVQGGTLTCMEAEEDGKLWEVTVVTGDGTAHEMDVDAETGRVTSGPETEDSDKKRNRELVEGAKLDYVGAARKALTQVPGARITELNLDRENKKVVWETELVDEQDQKRELNINAQQGGATGTATPSPSPSPTES
ncbi:PepSY domain-containing protein [Bailinhaonella thermotolerans]|uniref:PepSY domain-containing protein n=1 Tax=Bailinhaonella thermotolerans TaxID=1070861 RepID=A0A3A4AYK8_9ACTN|nr:PepSY domain-containing protein [Bailinhaonella thermotolerans]RJL30933.1 hypothetical protein D5H75_21825 [Bailinhaonella thermotolerans]